MDDARAIFDAYAQDPEVTRYLVWAPHRSLAETEEFLRRVTESPDLGSDYHWGITEAGDDTLRGMIALRPRGYKAEVGYVLARPFWGRGYMTEALRAVLEFAFSLPNMYRVWATCDAENIASARVLEKAGFDFEGILRRYTMHPNIAAEPRDVRCYAVTR